MDIKDRINEFRESKHLSVKAFEQEINVSNGSWEKAKTLSEDVLIKIITRFPELDPCWLLKGENRDTSINVIESLKSENALLKEELKRIKALRLPTKDSKVYNLWMKFMEVTEEMSKMYNEAKGELIEKTHTDFSLEKESAEEYIEKLNEEYEDKLQTNKQKVKYKTILLSEEDYEYVKRFLNRDNK